MISADRMNTLVRSAEIRLAGIVTRIETQVAVKFIGKSSGDRMLDQVMRFGEWSQLFEEKKVEFLADELIQFARSHCLEDSKIFRARLDLLIGKVYARRQKGMPTAEELAFLIQSVKDHLNDN